MNSSRYDRTETVEADRGRARTGPDKVRRGRAPDPAPGFEIPARPVLLDDRSQPDFPAVYRGLMREAEQVDVAATRIRLSGLRVSPEDLEAPAVFRVLLMELNALMLRTEADRLAIDPAAVGRLRSVRRMLDQGSLLVRCMPLGGWAPDFSIFHSSGRGPAAIIGPHWMERPYPHRGPGFASLHRGRSARRVLRRFDELWSEGHDVGRALRRALDARSPPSESSPARVDSAGGFG